jgi:uncharacterized protein
MRERWAAIPDFQRTRGALRFLAACLRAARREGKSRSVLGPGDVPIHDAEVRLAFFKEVGQQSDFQAVLEHDLVGANARCRRIDDRRAKEHAAEAIRRPATRLATAILMYSFGGLRRESGQEGDVLPPGVTEAELLSVCIGPDLDSTTALACLKELKEQCLYLHFDGARYCFKKDPNVTLLIEQEAEAVGRNDKQVRARIKEMIEARQEYRMSSPEAREGQRAVPPQLDENTLEKLDKALQNWDSSGSEVRRRFEESRERWAGIVQPLVEAISASERLTKDDLAVRINTRD